MPTRTTTPSPPRGQRGGYRPGAGRKPKWPSGTAMKTMRLPAVLEDELRRYAHQRLAELQRDQARAASRHAAGPPPKPEHVHMKQITSRHFTIEHEKQVIGDVCRLARDRWLACLYDTAADDHAFAEGETRQDAVAALLSQARTRWARARGRGQKPCHGEGDGRE